MPNPFDRTQAQRPQAASTTKLAVVGVLAAALLGVLALNHYSGAPRPADAAGIAAGTAADPLKAQGSPDAIAAALANDPTAELLVKPAANDMPELDLPPSNPFLLSAKWRSELVKPAPVRPVVTPAIEPAPRPAAVVPNVNWDAIKIQGVVRDATQSYAIINGLLARPGTIVIGLRVIEIAEDHITFCPVGASDAARFDYPLKAKSRN